MYKTKTNHQGYSVIVNREFPPEIATWLQVVDEQELLMLSRSAVAEEEDKRSITEILHALHKTRPFKDIKDPVAWQREIRKDRDLPGRQ